MIVAWFRLCTKLLRNEIMKTITKIEFKDTAIAKIKVDELEFSYTDKASQIRHKDRLYIPFNVPKRSTLKGLKLCVHKRNIFKINNTNNTPPK